MDPNQTWQALADAFQEEDENAITEHAANLLEWLARGGFPPTITRHQAFDAQVARATCAKLLEKDY